MFENSVQEQTIRTQPMWPSSKYQCEKLVYSTNSVQQKYTLDQTKQLDLMELKYLSTFPCQSHGSLVDVLTTFTSYVMINLTISHVVKGLCILAQHMLVTCKHLPELSAC